MLDDRHYRLIAKLILKSTEKIMSAIDDLNAAITTLQTNADAAASTIARELAAIATAQAASGNYDPAIEQAVINIKVASDKLAAAAASVNPPETPTPAT